MRIDGDRKSVCSARARHTSTWVSRTLSAVVGRWVINRVLAILRCVPLQLKLVRLADCEV